MHLLLNTAQFEYKLKNAIQLILNNRKTRWDDNKRECKERVTELSEVRGLTP